MPKAKKPRDEWPFKVWVMPYSGSGILRASVASWEMTETSKGRPFIRFVAQMPDSNTYRFLVMPNFEKYCPRPEVMSEIMEAFEEKIKAKAKQRVTRKAELKAEKEEKDGD